jgi:hypothetical protein
MTRLTAWLRLWFTFDRLVDRRDAIHGAAMDGDIPAMERKPT